MIRRGWQVDEADLADDVTEAEVADKPAEADKAEAYEANDAEADEADAKVDEADVANEATETDEADLAGEATDATEADWANKADAIDEVGAADDSIMIDKVVLGLLTLFLPFSLTKHSAIFAEVKGFFGINNNQLGSLKGGCLSPCSLMIRFVCGNENNNQPLTVERLCNRKCGWGRTCSLRIRGVDISDNQPGTAAIKIEHGALLRRPRFN